MDRVKAKEQGGNEGKDGESGNQPSEEELKEIYEIYKEQQLIRSKLERQLKDMIDASDRKLGQKLARQMENFENELLENGITQQGLNKLNNIQYELLKLEKAAMKQGKKQERESNSNKNKFNNPITTKPSLLEDYRNEIEILNRQALPLRQNFQNKLVKNTYSNWISKIVGTEYGEVAQLDYIFCDDAYLLEINNECSFDTELRRVMAHGILHLLGYGDKSEDEAVLQKAMFDKIYDVIVVGGGHAGSEAAAAAANMGSSTLLITMNLQNIGQMSCNPAMGGIAKGQIVREIDALGGYSGIITDKSAIQFKMLNKSKGPAMWSPRAQSDRMRFAEEWRLALENTPNCDFYQEMVSGLIVENGKVTGVKTSLGLEVRAKSVVLTNGTFLNGLIHIGEKQFGGGRAGEKAATGITEQLTGFGFESGRMKTGTPPRVDGRSLDYSKMIIQPGDAVPEKFSYTNTKALEHQRDCHMSHTSALVHDLLKEGFDRSPMFNGRIRSIGPRYCPSIEDKINRFADKDSHQLFVEPEGWNTVEVYVNGFSTSLPEDVQFKALRSVVGFENVKFFRPGYAIEYDYFPPTQLKHTLETKLVGNLYFAGQINGTTGYEEAASQGLMAGINAHLKVKEQEEFILKRDEAYIGVLIDDLITKGTEEPYRMFTSRAEYRTLLRQDNADLRLTPKGYKIGLASKERLERMEEKERKSNAFIKFFNDTSVLPKDINPILESLDSALVKQSDKMVRSFSRPKVTMQHMLQLDAVSAFVEENNLDREVLEQTEVQVKYSGYIAKEKNNADKLHRLEDVKIPKDFDYTKAEVLIDYKITKGKKFKRELSKRQMFIFEDSKDAEEFYNFVNIKFQLDHTDVYDDIPFEIDGEQYFFAWYEIEIPDKTLNLLPIVVDVALLASDINPVLENSYSSRKGNWYVALEVYNDAEPDCLEETSLSREIVLKYLRTLKKEYLATHNYNETVFKN
ncbi:tRNA uridine 5-carboxymethylaminomethyl modification enzyme MnmG [Nymphon striatum]|nr:tRNA uridine 5-carboxymethylaminomethyl modification enzyme MnmG [Nymphon striatum]